MEERTAELRSVNEQLRQEVEQRRRLQGQILETDERVQRRIGQDLHDNLCSQLTGIEFASQALAQKLAGVSSAQASRARKISRLLRDAMGDARELARGLSPLSLEAHGLAHGLRDLAGRTGKVYRCRCSFRCHPAVRIVDPAKALHLYRIAQEAMANAVNHGRARRIGVALAAQGDAVVVRVTDDGCGMAPNPRRRKGQGLITMNSRAAMLGGTLAVQPNPAGGTEVICTIPGLHRPPKERRLK